ncbi:protein mono-ADP-ribosyltransferase PARP4-like [Triticum dicoccoides]|uniref:protein mono-ADP-ribosyltransferase PARP4-like n=1 Tax=Triticum dicoccoides TaxID=85692 RepID=UPI0018901348|nr:protein mono-ADP-ribosyltransferase PARP4-like [Triticum dicoccoides]
MTLCKDLVLTHLPIVIPSMPGIDQSFNAHAYLRYIFGEKNEPEQVGEHELHRPVQTPWPIGSDIGVTVLGSTINILQRRCDEQFAIHRAKDPKLLGGMIDDPPKEPPSSTLRRRCHLPQDDPAARARAPPPLFLCPPTHPVPEASLAGFRRGAEPNPSLAVDQLLSPNPAAAGLLFSNPGLSSVGAPLPPPPSPLPKLLRRCPDLPPPSSTTTPTQRQMKEELGAERRGPSSASVVHGVYEPFLRLYLADSRRLCGVKILTGLPPSTASLPTAVRRDRLATRGKAIGGALAAAQGAERRSSSTGTGLYIVGL